VLWAERKDYELAIASIERGLKKGGVTQLDEAYVYLGLSKQAIGDMDGARNAFGKLKDVPGISRECCDCGPFTRKRNSRIRKIGTAQMRRADND